MADPIRLYLDQHVHGGVARGLARHGSDALTAQDAGRCGFPDDEQLRFATAGGRVVVTHDTDYLDLAAQFAAAGESHAGIAWCHALTYNVGQLIHELMILHGASSPAEMVDAVHYL
jgi:hypothetical protein